MIKTMNNKMTTNSQLSTNEPKKNKRKTRKTKTKQTTRTGTESQKRRSHGGLSAGRERGQNRVKGTGNKKHNGWNKRERGRLRII